jgi:2C-methyl-D-erythritol 2,4-cyclodiphosphate synthase
MEENIAVALDTEQGAVNVKATTTEGLGFAGAGQGIASYAVAIVVKKLPG